MATQSRIGWRPYVNLSTATYLVDTYSGSTAVYSLRKVNSTYTGPAIKVRRVVDNTESDINFKSNGDLDTTALLSFANPVFATFSILDNYPGASVAYSLRKVRTAYTGSAIRVRRSSDNTEQDIAFDSNGNLNTTSLLAFVGSGSGYVVKWYDQSGNNNSLFKTSATNQPRIVNAGVVETIGGKPAVRWITIGGVENLMGLTTELTNVQSVFMNITYLSGAGMAPLLGHTTYYDYHTDGVVYLNTTHAASYVLNGSKYINGISKTNATFTKSSSNSLISMIHTSASGRVNQISSDRVLGSWFSGYFSEIILYPNNQTNNRAKIESNMNGYYSIHSNSYGSDVYVTTWYDQSGSARHSTQITAAAQPLIVTGGSLILASGKPAIYFDGVDDTLRLSTPLPVSDITTLFTVAFANYENTANDIVLGRRAAMSYRYSGGNSTVAGLCITRAESADYIYASTPASTTGLNTLAVFHTHYAYGNYDGLNRTRIYSNGVWRNDANGVGTSGFSQVEYIGSGGDCQFFKNTIQELVYYPSNQLNNRIAIENNINSYYSLWDRTAVVSNGLVLNLDASDINSYYKTGTEWFNIAATSSTIKGTLMNGPVFSTANGGVINFDGVNDYVDCGNSLTFNQTNTLTLSTWVKINSFASTNTLIGKQWCYGNQYSYSLAIDTQGKLQFYYSLDGGYCGGTFANYISSNSISTNTWYNIVLSFTNTSVKLYLNGQLISGIQTGINTSLYVSNSPVLLGIYRNLSGTYGDALNGSMGSTLIYNRALSATEILQNFNVTKSRFGL